MLQYFIFRIKQIWGVYKHAGLLRLPFLLMVSALLLVYLFRISQDSQYVNYVLLTFVAITSLVHIKRKDKLFLKVHFEEYRLLFLLDYLLLNAVVLFAFICYSHYLQLLILLFSLLLISSINFKIEQKTRNNDLLYKIPNFAFEWKAGIRRHFVILLFLYIISILGSFIVLVPLAILFIISLFFLSFYNESEPIQMVLAFQLSSQQFLKNKIKNALLLFSLSVIPIIVTSLLFNYEYWYVIIVEYILFVTAMVYTILVKYSFYIPQINIYEPYVTTGLLFCIIVPVFVPFVWISLTFFYPKAIRNLNLYLDDFN